MIPFFPIGLFGFAAMLGALIGCSAKEQVTDVWPNGAARVVEYRDRAGELIKREERHFNYLRHSEVPYRNGLPHGEYRSWRSDGTPEWSGSFEQGKQTGEWTLWLDRRGSLLQKGSYSAGEKEGEWLAFHGNGTVREKSVWCKGAPCGVWETFDLNGKLVSRSSCWKGIDSGVFQRFNREGRVELEYTCRDSLKNGTWQRRDFLGNLMEERHYLNDTLHGTVKTWFASGAPYGSSLYSHGKRDGAQIATTAQGDTAMSCILIDGSGRCLKACEKNRRWICADSSWRNGVLEGKVVTWNLASQKDVERWERGELKQRTRFKMTPIVVAGDTVRWSEARLQEGEFVDGLKSGLWKQWNSKGLLLEEATFEKGKLRGEQLIYDSTGRLSQKRIHHGEHRGVTIEQIAR